MANANSKPTLVVGVGASAGGLEACKQLLTKLPADSGFALIVVMHLDPLRISHLAEILETSGILHVVQVTSPQQIKANYAYVIAPNTSLSIVHGELQPGQPLERAGTGSGVIDVLFSSLGAFGPDAAAIVLSGIGSDGSAGMADIKAAGGLCLVQDPATAEHPAMPRSAIATGLADAVLAPEAMPEYLLAYAASPRAPVEPPPPTEPELPGAEEFDNVMRLLAIHHGFDARDYKKGTLMRRAQRRLALLPFGGWDDYLRHIQEHPEELVALYQDVLIGVTQFFRDPEQWEYLEREIIPNLLDGPRGKHEPVRIWSAGCATGEEPYSLAMVFLEQLESRGSRAKLQVFATDVSQKAIAFARRALYPASIADDVTPGRLAQ